MSPPPLSDMSDHANDTCPYCDSPMRVAWFLIGGGVWFSESRDRAMRFGLPLEQRKPDEGSHSPVHCVIGERGHRGPGTWPKEGLYCERCGTIVVKTKPA